MLAILRATALLGSSSVVNLLVGLISVKAWATFVGPAGLGQLGLLQGLLSLASILAGLGAGAAIVRFGARPVADGEHEAFAAYRAAAWWLFVALGGLTFALMAIFQGPIAGWMLGDAQLGGHVVLIGLALMFMLAAGLHIGILNAHHQVGALAQLMILNTLAGASLNIGLIWAFGTAGIGPAVLAGAVANWAIARAIAQRHAPPRGRASPAAIWQAGRELARFGLPFTASALVGSGVHFLVPIMVLHGFGIAAVGFHRAALTISDRYMGVMLTAMGQDYYPRLSATERTPEALSAIINLQFRLVLLIGAPLILGLIAVATWIVPLVYTASFAPVVGIVEWQMVGNMFRFTSWAMAYAILAHCPGRVYFLTELAGGLATLAAHWVALSLWGIQGLGLAFLGVYGLYFLLVWSILRRRFDFVLTAENQTLLAVFTAAAAGVVLLPAIGLAAIKAPLALMLTAAAVAFSAATLWRETRAAMPASELANER